MRIALSARNDNLIRVDGMNMKNQRTALQNGVPNRTTWTAALAVFALAGCGGGGSDNPGTPTPPPAAQNQAPSVQAGADKTTEMPADTVQLQGSATDDQTTLTYAWSMDSGTGTVTFGSPSAAATSAKFSTAGTYQLKLSVSDGTSTGTDTVIVTVNAAVYPGADVETDPAHGWQTTTPAAAGMQEAKLNEARDYALTGGGSGVIVRNGRLVYQWGDIDQRLEVKSSTKSIGGMVLGLALDDNRLALTDLAQTRVATMGDNSAITFPTATNLNTNDITKLDDITVLQLATHTAGFEKDDGVRTDPQTTLPVGNSRLIHDPGTKWDYSDSALNWLADVLTTAYGQDLRTVLQERALSVMQITDDDLRWRDNAYRHQQLGGIPRRELASGMLVNTNAMARVGLLFLRKGVWGSQRVLSESFVNMVQTPPPSVAPLQIADPIKFPGATTSYGVLWWTNKTGLLPGVPRDAYWAWGKGDSLIVVIPSLDLVIARNGNSDAPPVWRPEWNGDYAALAPFLVPIVASVTP